MAWDEVAIQEAIGRLAADLGDDYNLSIDISRQYREMEPDEGGWRRFADDVIPSSRKAVITIRPWGVIDKRARSANAA